MDPVNAPFSREESSLSIGSPEGAVTVIIGYPAGAHFVYGIGYHPFCYTVSEDYRKVDRRGNL